MPLQKVKVPINLAQGLDTKTDSKHLQIGKLVKLENAVYSKVGRLDKRNGFDALSQYTTADVKLEDSDGLAVFNSETLLYKDQKIYSHSANADRWIDKGQCVSVIAKSKQVVKNTAEQTQIDSATVNGIAVYAWEDSRGGVRCSVIDETNGVALLNDTVVDASASRARCLAFQGFLYIFYYKSGSLFVRRVNPLAATALDTAVEISTTVNTSTPHYDVYNYDGLRILWAHNVQGASEIKAGWLNSVPEVLSGAFAAVTYTGCDVDNCLAIIKGPSQLFYIAFHSSTSGLECVITNNGLTELESHFVVDSHVATNIVNVTGYVSAATTVTLFYQVAAAATYNHFVKQATVTTAAVVGTPAVFKRSVGLWTKVFMYTDRDGNEYNYIGLTHSSTLQASYFVAKVDGTLAAKLQYTTGGGLSSRAILQNVSELEANAKYLFGILKKNKLISENSTLFTQKGVSRTVLDFSNADVLVSKQLGNNLHIVGGFLQAYDGVSVVEHGFHLYPENVSLGQSASGGSLSDGTYQVVFLYEWTDNYGQIHRSAPSVPVSIAVSGGGSSQKITATCPTLRLTAKDGTTRTNVSLVGYITEAAGEIFYRFTSITSPTFNDITADTVAVDATVVTISNELLYTTGGVLDNMPPPACSCIEVFKNRLVVGGLEDEIGFFHSKEFKDDYAVEFSDEFKKNAEPDGGDLTAFAVLDDKLLCLKGSRFYYTYGDGPNDLGEGQSFAELTFQTADIGCDVQVSIVRMPRGIMLKTGKGIYVIDAGMNTIYIGADVEAFNDKTITSAVLVDDLNQVRFTCSDGPMLIYDYEAQQWSTIPNLQSYGAVMSKQGYVLLKTNGKILKENATKYRDDQSSYGMTVETGWIALDGIGGFQRVYRAYFLGDYYSPHKLRVSIAYDYSPAWVDQFIYDPVEELEISTYGDDSPYGEPEDGVFGGDFSSYRFEAHLKQQKCEAIKFKIEEIVSTSTEGNQRGLNISDIALLVGIKGGLSKFKRAQTVGADS